MLTFIIPVRHQDNARDWLQLVDYLRSTVGTLAGQDDPRWQAVIVANEGARLPEFPAKVRVHRVTFPPNPFHDPESADLETYRDAVRLDKGRRILAGMRAAGPTDYFMVVDDDDFVGRGVAGFVGRAAGQPGWHFGAGYVWSTGGRLLYVHDNFHKYCGTSHVVRADLIDLGIGDDEAGVAYVKRMLGSHIYIADDLAARGTPLAPLPFIGAVYRIGHAGSHSRSSSVLRTFLLNRWVLKSPRRTWRALRRFRLKTPAVDREFFASPPA
ncbi:MAG: galactosyl transferase [Burkholderiaceae bacterium]